MAAGDVSSGEDQQHPLKQETEDESQRPATENGGRDTTGAPDVRQENRTRAEVWARRAALAAGLVRKRRGRDTPERRLAFESRLGAKARRLVGRVVLPGEWYLVRCGGTRKGSGSFYTRPGLAVPTVQRTLRPLAYDPPAGPDGEPDPDAPPASWTPRLPERILTLKVCDPACGSGTFPLAALRFLTEAVYASLQHHGRIEPDGERALVRLLGIGNDEHPQTAYEPSLSDELIPCPPDDEHFESRLKAVLRRHVVEQCIYAADLDPLAVELCRLSLWIETMDRNLPFGFLDHKIKCGNALIGAWFDQFRHYPVMAWKNREGGDKNHNNGVHFLKNARTRKIKDFVKETLTPDLRDYLEGRTLYQPDLLAKSVAAHDEAYAVLARMHAMPVHDTAERARHYREHFLGSQSWRSLKHAMDLWCACWFWPAEEIEHAPLPSTFAEPPEETRAVADRIAAEMRFFHWEWEFPDVFHPGGTGFDAILGNPPWDIAKPISKEFFSNLDPLYRSYGKQVALRKQSNYFEDAELERDWLEYNARFRAQSNYMSRSASPFGDPEENSKEPEPLPGDPGTQEPETSHTLADSPPPCDRIRRSIPPVPPSGLGGPEPVQALSGSRPRASETQGATWIHRSLRPLLRQWYPGVATPVSRALLVGVVVRNREPRQGLSDSQELQVQPGHRGEGGLHRSHPHDLHAPRPGRLGARRGTHDVLFPGTGGAVQSQQPRHS